MIISLNKLLIVPNKGMWLFFVFYEAIVARRIISEGSYILLTKEHCLRWTWFYLGMVQKNSAPEKIVYIWQIEANGIYQ